jgi:peptidoglycan/xylan/chitin deacetylase (PgdA/CDA1 family)
MKRLAYQLYAGARCDRLVWAARRKRLRILTYHGVCEDHLAAEPWMPPFFVTRSSFEYQMRYLTRHAQVLPLSEAVRLMEQGRLPDKAASVTFDDGYANNLHVAYPILKALAVPATIFLATAYQHSGDLFPFDRISLIDVISQGRAWRGDRIRKPLVAYADHPLDFVLDRAQPWWPETLARLSAEQIATLRPLIAEEIDAFDAGIIEFGAHTDTHCILRNESQARRLHEITESIRKTAELTGRPPQLFSFPNGRPGDFGEDDKAALRFAGMKAAVSTTSGTNGRRSDRFALARYSLGLGHTASSFKAEVTGFRPALMSLLGRV